MKRDSNPVTTPVIAAAMRRRRAGRGTRFEEVENNYVAQTRVTIGHNSGNRKGAGARPGNRNAETHGATTAEMRAFRLYVWTLCRSARRLLALRKAAIAAMKFEAKTRR
jgi:hypothetical protein